MVLFKEADMTERKKLKRAIRDHAERTGVTYSTAARNLGAFGPPPGKPPTRNEGSSDDEPSETIPTHFLQDGFDQITVTVNLDGWHKHLPIFAPIHSVGYAVIGEFENGVLRLDTGKPTLIVFSRKTPADDSCYGALARAKSRYAALAWLETSGVNNGGTPGARTPYWWMTWDVDSQGIPVWDQGKGVQALDDVLRTFTPPVAADR